MPSKSFEDIISLIGKTVSLTIKAFLILFFGMIGYIIYAISHPYSDSDFPEKDAGLFAQRQTGLSEDSFEKVLYSRHGRVATMQDSHSTEGVIMQLTKTATEKLSLSGAVFAPALLTSDHVYSYEPMSCFRAIMSNSGISPELADWFRLTDEQENRFILKKSKKGAHTILFDRKTGKMALCQMEYGVGSIWND